MQQCNFHVVIRDRAFGILLAMYDAVVREKLTSGVAVSVFLALVNSVSTCMYRTGELPHPYPATATS